MDDQVYLEKLKPFQEGLPPSDPESNKKRYLIKGQQKSEFDLEGTIKRFQHLLNLSGLFRHFIERKAAKDEKFQKVLNILDNPSGRKGSRGSSHQDKRRRKTKPRRTRSS